MLQFYYNPLSPLSRRVWLALLEKEIPFTPITVNLKEGEQFQRKFLAINPFHHVPVIIDDGLRVLESLAILDYLECKYPHYPLLPKEPSQLAKVKMAQMVANNELSALVISLITDTEDSPQLKKARRKITRILNFLADLLADDAYFGGENLSLGDIVAGNAVILVAKLGFDLSQKLEIFKQTVQELVKSQGKNQIVNKVKQSS